MDNEINRLFNEQGPFTEVDYPFFIKPNFSTLGSIIDVFIQEPLIRFLLDDSKRNLLRFNASTLYEEYNLSPNQVGILSFDNNFLETDNAQGMIFKDKKIWLNS